MQHPDDGIIHAWLDGELDTAESARIEALVARDPEWAAAAAEARGLIAASSRIVHALDRVPANVVPARPRAPKRPWWIARVAALLVLVAGTAVVWRRGTERAAIEPRALPSPLPLAESPVHALPKAPTALTDRAKPRQAQPPAPPAALSRAAPAPQVRVTNEADFTIKRLARADCYRVVESLHLVATTTSAAGSVAAGAKVDSLSRVAPNASAARVVAPREKVELEESRRAPAVVPSEGQILMLADTAAVRRARTDTVTVAWRENNQASEARAVVHGDSLLGIPHTAISPTADALRTFRAVRAACPSP